jgi:hypothetical protein
MPSTYTTNGGIELPANGEQSGTWGETINDNMSIIDRLTNGVGSISLSGTTHTLTTTDGTLSDGQYNVLVLGGSPSGTNTITISPNDGEHVYIVKNISGQTATFTQGSGASISVLNNTTKIIYADGAGAGAAVVDITGALDLGSLIIAGTSVTATAAELNFVDGVTSNVQTQLNTKAPLASPTFTGTVTANGGAVFNESGADVDFRVESDTDANALFVQGSDGFVGIGTSSPAALLHVAKSDDGGTVEIILENSFTNAGSSTDEYTQIQGRFGGYDASYILTGKEGDFTTAELRKSYLAFSTRTATTGITEKVRIDSSGNVGIGTSSPAHVLHLASSAPNLRIEDTDGGYADINVDAGSIELRSDQGNTQATSTLKMFVDGSEAMRIDSSGRVGIGTSSPDALLHVEAADGAVGGAIRYTSTGVASVYMSADGAGLCLATDTAGITFRTGVTGNDPTDTGTERMRIDSSGDLSVGHAGGLGPIRISAISTVADFAMYLRNDHATTPYGIAIKFLTEQNDTGSSFLNCVDGAAQRFTVTPNGGLANYQANDSNLSDELEKNQFGQLDSTSDCVRSWEIVKYLYKDEDQTNPHKYGVIAQQIEEHCPEVITNWVKVKASDEVLWSEEDNDIPEGVSVGDVKTEAVEQVDRMAVKEQQMFWMLVKSHQEALNKIDAMEIRLSALEG